MAHFVLWPIGCLCPTRCDCIRRLLTGSTCVDAHMRQILNRQNCIRLLNGKLYTTHRGEGGGRCWIDRSKQ
ncbi:hypothetical protein QBC46DRAFT_385950 [Diplogelasinospora grovesii]|uniref:Secreted protein n=1 Tax=Diplogelasinospora grovesii TaxID=303347 RepID=A0AAN6N7F7_9PEZI|nr:hypothetical protein QBC46DRAFT_385950 [Diplogelasinospora grovesii]